MLGKCTRHAKAEDKVKRRALLLAAIFGTAAGSMASECSAASDSPRTLTSKGMQLFKEAKVEESVLAFDKAIELDDRCGCFSRCLRSLDFFVVLIL